MIRPSIDAVIEQVLSVTKREEPGGIADEVVRQIAVTDYKIYLKQLILHRLSSVAGRAREKANPVRPGVSTKQQLIREQYWPKFLMTKIATPTGYKTMAELTADDLETLAAFRRAQAGELVAKADQFDQLASMMRAADVKVLEQLPREQGEKALNS